MAGKARPSLRKKTLENVMLSNLSVTDKECIKAVFDEVDGIVRCRECEHLDRAIFVCTEFDAEVGANHFCSLGKKEG